MCTPNFLLPTFQNLFIIMALWGENTAKLECRPFNALLSVRILRNEFNRLPKVVWVCKLNLALLLVTIILHFKDYNLLSVQVYWFFLQNYYYQDNRVLLFRSALVHGCVLWPAANSLGLGPYSLEELPSLTQFFADSGVPASNNKCKVSWEMYAWACSLCWAVVLAIKRDISLFR